jgi:hypothetical protein
MYTRLCTDVNSVIGWQTGYYNFNGFSYQVVRK